MDKIIKILQEQNEGICKVLYQNWKGETYEAHISPEEFKVRILSQRLHFAFGIPEKLIKEFEQAIQNSQIKNDSWNEE